MGQAAPGCSPNSARVRFGTFGVGASCYQPRGTADFAVGGLGLHLIEPRVRPQGTFQDL